MQKLIHKLRHTFSQKYRFEHDMKIAKHIGETITGSIQIGCKVTDCSIASIPLTKEVVPLLGFISAASDVMAQALGKEPGSTAGLNGMLYTIHGIFPQNSVPELMQLENILQSYQSPPDEYTASRILGEKYMNAFIKEDADGVTINVLQLFNEFLSKYCKNK